MTAFEASDYYPIVLESLPPGWAWSWLGEACASVTSGFASGDFNKSARGVPHLRPMNISRQGELDLGEVKYVAPEAGSRRLEPGDVLFNNTNSPALIGKTCAIASGAVLAFSNHMTRLQPGRGINSHFLARQLHYLWSSGFFLHRCSKHVNQASVSAQALAETVPVVVAPHLEQDRIVAALDSYLTRLAAAEAALLRVQANLKRYRASVLKAAVEGRLVPTEAELARREGRDYEPASQLLNRILAERRRQWEEAELAKMKSSGRAPEDDGWKAEYQEPVEPDVTQLPELPEGWCWAMLPQLGELARGKSRHRPRNDKRLFGGPYPFIQTGEVRESAGSIEAYRETYSEVGLAQSRLWPAGTLCITIAANIAETGILGFAACFPDSVVGLLNLEQPVMIRYVERFLRTAREGLERYAPATAQKNINLATLEEVAVPLPPAVEQLRIVQEVDRLLSLARHLEFTADQNQQHCSRLRQAILKWAFEGKLVDQDPSDEPAGELLARIRAEREAAAHEQRPARSRSSTSQPSRTTLRKPQ